MKPKHSLVIRWSEEDHCYIAWLPEFGSGVKTHGDTYEEAARMGEQLIESMIHWHKQDGSTLPEPWLFSEPEIDERIGHQLFPQNQAYKAPRKARRTA
jgi:predicted RNase H-like HicB family nuclease